MALFNSVQFNEEFVANTNDAGDLFVYDYNNEVVYKIFNYYFPLDYPLARALFYLTRYFNDPRYVYQIGNYIYKDIEAFEKKAELLFTAKLAIRKDLDIPTMLLHRNVIFDTHVPLEIVFFPKGRYGGIPFNTIYSTPADVTDEESTQKYCVDCTKTGSYRGVFFALCAYCVENVYCDKSLGFREGYEEHRTLGDNDIGNEDHRTLCNIYEIPPEKRIDALPQYMTIITQENLTMNDIGYVEEGVDVAGCSLIEPVKEITYPNDGRLYLHINQSGCMWRYSSNDDESTGEDEHDEDLSNWGMYGPEEPDYGYEEPEEVINEKQDYLDEQERNYEYLQSKARIPKKRTE